MAGYAGRVDGCVAVHDDLMGRVLVLDDGATQLALITLDVIGLDAREVNTLREGITSATGIPKHLVIVCCSHTHSGPVMPSSDPRRDPFQEREPEPIPARVQVLIEHLVGAVKHASDHKHVVSLRFLEGALEGWSQNRRRVAQGGLPIDPEIRGLVFVRESDEPLAIVVNYACHPTVMGGKNLTISADYPGAMARCVGRVFKDCSVMFVNGACADINPNWFKVENNSFDTVERFGRALGGRSSVLFNRLFR